MRRGIARVRATKGGVAQPNGHEPPSRPSVPAGPHAVWSGYFVSRSALKGYIRFASSVFQAAKQVQLFTGGAPDVGPSNPLYRLERSMGVVQHHDAVRGWSA